MAKYKTANDEVNKYKTANYEVVWVTNVISYKTRKKVCRYSGLIKP